MDASLDAACSDYADPAPYGVARLVIVFGPTPNATLRVLSFGGGVQSTTLKFMAEHGEIDGPPLDFAIMSDLKAESQDMREHVRWMQSGNAGRIPLILTDGGDLEEREWAAAKHEKRNAVPFYTSNSDGGTGRLTRACTRDFKIRPVEKEIRKLLGLKKGQRVPAGVIVEQWIGISLDEIHRATPSKVPWINQRWPLLEKRMRRADCEAWLIKNGYPVPAKSACWFCPFTSDARWARMKRENTEDWQNAVRMDAAIRRGFKGSTQEAFIHRSREPLSSATFIEKDDAFHFGQECSGRCGT